MPSKSATLAAATLLAVLAATSARAADAPKSLTGLWLLDGAEYEGPRAPMSLSPAGLALQKEMRAKTTAVQSTLSDRARKCMPSGMPGMMANEFALQVLETPDRVSMFNEASTLPRNIYLNETEHTKGVEPGWNGHSIGHYEGKGDKTVLVIDTVNLNDRMGAVNGRGVHSPTTHLVERYYLAGPDQLVGEMTFEDPNYLAKPFKTIHHYNRIKGKAELWEYACETDAPGWSERFDGDPAAKLSQAQ